MKHGGDLTEAKARHGAGDPPWLDLSTGINPHPWPVPEALRQVGWERLPGAEETDRLLAAARAAYRVPDAAEIVAAPGTQALIQWLPRLAPPGDVAIHWPTYGGHAEAWRSAGREVVKVEFVGSALASQPPPPPFGRSPCGGGDEAAPSASPPPQGEGDQAKPGGGGCAATIRHRVLVTPNNPDGRTFDLPILRDMAESCAASGGWLVVDEAFADLDPAIGAAALAPELPVVVLRSFGKFYGLAGLRLGFAIAPPAIAEPFRAALGDWAVSGPALAVGAAAIADRAWAEAMRERLARKAAALDRVLGEAGLSPVGGTSLFRLVRHPNAAALHERLAAEHIWCRRFDWAPDLLRIGLPADEAGLARLAEALARHVQGTKTASPATLAR